jgi:hypothetical protein
VEECAARFCLRAYRQTLPPTGERPLRVGRTQRDHVEHPILGRHTAGLITAHHSFSFTIEASDGHLGGWRILRAGRASCEDTAWRPAS